MHWQFREFGWRLLPGGIAALLVGILLQFGGWQPLEQMAYTLLFQVRGSRPWSEQVVVIGIDEASLAAVGKFPWSRQHYISLLNLLAPAEPTVIVFDLVFSESSADDELLAAAMQNQGRVVLAQAWDSAGHPVVPRPLLAEAAIATGHILKHEDSDGLIRQLKLQIQDVPAISVVAAQVYSLVKTPVQLPDLGQPLWINWPGPVRQVPHYSFAAVIQREIPLQTFRHKIVVVGVTASGLVDAIATPYDRNPPASGVYLHAAAIENLLRQNSLNRAHRGGWVLILFLASPGISFVTSRWRISRQLLAGAGLCGSWWGIGLLLFRANYWLPLIWPAGLFSLTIGTAVLFERIRVGALLQRKLDPLWQLHHQDLSSGVRSPDLNVEPRNPQPQPTGLLKTVAKLTHLTETLSQLAHTDGLTQVANRYAFDRSLDLEWQRARREHQPLSLILCDVDFFKRYNDTYGHQAGDWCLQHVAAAIRQSARRPADLTARYGGEEFAVILPNTDAAGAVSVAENICTQVRALKLIHASSEASSHVTLSVGVSSVVPQFELSAKTLVETADRALYQAKHEGRDRVILRAIS